MKKIGFMGVYDKTDLVIYIAKMLTSFGKKVIVVDATNIQKAKYVIPAINPTTTYVTEFEEYLPLKDMRSISTNADMPQYIKFIYENDPLYDVIKEWDEAFSLDGNLCNNPAKTKQLILQKARMKGRK